MPAHAALRRAFPPREHFRGRAVASALWSLLGSLLLCVTLFDLYLIADLLISGGAAVARGAEGRELAALAGRDSAGAVPLGYGVADAGILHAVWANRGGFFGPGLAWLYRALPPLRHDLPALGLLVGVGVVAGLLRSLCRSLARLDAAKAASAAVTRARRAIHRQALRLGPSDLTDDGPAAVLDLFTNAGQTLKQGLLDGVLYLGRHPAKIALLVGFALLVSPLATVQCAVPLLACWYLLRGGRRGVAKARLLAAHRSDRDLRLLAEGLTKSRVVCGYGMEEFEADRFNANLARYQADLAAAGRRERVTRGLGRALLTLCVAVVVFLLGAKVLAGGLSAAAALLLLGIFACLIEPMTRLADLRMNRHAAAVAAERIYRYLNRVPEVGQAVSAKFLQPLARELRFENVHYRDPRRPGAAGRSVGPGPGRVGDGGRLAGPAGGEGPGEPAAAVFGGPAGDRHLRRRGHRLGHAGEPAGGDGLRRRRGPLLHRDRPREPHRRQGGRAGREGRRGRQNLPRP